MNPYSSITALASPDLYIPIYDLLVVLCPDVNLNNIVRGWQNRVALPVATNEFMVMSILDVRRQGTNIYSFSYVDTEPSTGSETIYELFIGSIQIDFCSSKQQTALKRAQLIESISRSPYGVNFLEPYGINPLYADDPRDITFVDGSEQFVARVMTTLYFSFYTNTIATVATASELPFNLLNVDVFYPPTH